MEKRILSLAIALVILFVTAVGRTGYVALSGNYTVSSGYNSYTLTVTSQKQTLYDRNMHKINNNEDALVAIIRPNENCLSELSLLFEQDEVSEVAQELSKGYPVVRQIEHYVACKYIKIIEVKGTDVTALIKFIQKEYGETVYEESINFGVDAKGRLLDGDEGEITEEFDSSVPQGIVLTINNEIQKEVEEAAKYMRKGAVVVMDADSAEILAMYSAPDDNMFRPVMSYTVGSVFKLIVSVCALENGIDMNFTCTGKVKVGDTEFSCQNEKAHGDENIESALANSCNCFFVKLALKLGAENLIETAKSLGFGSNTEIMPGYVISDGNLPRLDILQTSKGQLSLLGFGQGLLTSTPLQFCTALCALSNGGLYAEPRLIAATIDIAGKQSDAPFNPSSRVISEETSNTLLKYMRYVVTNGTGAAADYNNLSAGKTSTAQSGIYENGKEVLNTWFAGVYPYDDPKYCIVVMTENGKSGSTDCCPIFRTIVENIT